MSFYYRPRAGLNLSLGLPPELRKAAGVSYPLTILWLIRATIQTALSLIAFLIYLATLAALGYAGYQAYIHR
jgi:hypothetical protein